MRLDLNDFEELKKFKKDNNKKNIKDIESFYQEEILKLKKEFDKKKENIKKEYFQKGLIEGEQKKEEELKNRIEVFKNELISKQKKSIEDLKNSYKNIENSLIAKNREYIDRLNLLLLDTLGEIFEFLYIQDSNIAEIKNQISKILDEFKDNLPLVIKVSSSLYDDIKDEFRNIKIQVDENLKNKDFIIEFSNFKIESKIEEKIEILKDEIKREIKKLT